MMISQARYKEVVQRHGEEYKYFDDDEFDKAVKSKKENEGNGSIHRVSHV